MNNICFYYLTISFPFLNAFIFLGPIINTDLFSFWTPKAPRCSSDYLHLHHGSVHCHNSNDFGSRCLYSCEPGFRLDGGTVVECQDNGQWSSPKPACRAVVCGSPPTVANGYLSCSSHHYSSYCTLSCHYGFLTVGSSVVTCQSNGHWDSVGSCRDVTPPTINCGPDVEVYAGPKRGKVSVVWSTPSATDNSGHVTVTSDVSSGSFFEVGQHLVNFYATDNAGLRSHCVMKIHVKDVTPPTINCGPDVEVYAGPKRGKVSVVWSTPSATDNSGHVTVTSDVSSGSFFEVGQHLVNFYATDNAGLRSHCDMKIHVKVKVCRVFEPPQNSTIVCSHENVLGSECTVLCPRGFQLVGDSLHVCQDNSLWGGEGAACQLRSCEPPVKVASGQVHCPNGTRFQNTCQLVCHPGFTPVGAGEITCQEDLTWTKSGYCQDVQPPLFVDGCHEDIHKEAASVGEDTRVVYNFPRVSDNSGQFLVSGHPQSGSRFLVGVTLVTLTAVDVSNNSVTCSFHVNVTYTRCKAPNIERNVNSLIVYGCPDGHVMGASCQLTCQDGSDVKGPTSIHCSRASGGRMTWTWTGNTRPSCNSKTCKPLPPPNNGALSCDVTNGTSRVCVVTCNENFVRQEGAPSSYMCTSSSQSWSPRNFVPNCLVPRRTQHVMTSPSFYYYSGNCSSDVSVVKEKFLTALSALELEVADRKVDVSEVKVTCGRQSKRRRSKRNLVYAYKLTPIIKIGIDHDVNRTVTSYSFVRNSINEKLSNVSTSSDLDLPGVGTFSKVTAGRLEVRCGLGTRLMKDSLTCVSCGQGYIYDTKTDKCRECPKDTYQDQDIGFTCKPCPKGTTTFYRGSVSLKQCQDVN